jgi:molybdate transport system substrate-binding protein
LQLIADYDVFAVLKRRIDAGEKFDIAILSPELIDQSGKSVCGHARRSWPSRDRTWSAEGLIEPDITSVDGFTRTMLNANSVAYIKEGTAALHFLSVLDRLGIAKDMKPKLKPYETATVVQAVLFR